MIFGIPNNRYPPPVAPYNIRFGHGIPDRLFRRIGADNVIIVQDDSTQTGIADHVLLTTAVNGNPAPKLGVMVEEKDGVLAITGISSNGPAQEAGLEKGDVIQVLNGQPIDNLADLKLALFYCQKDQTIAIRIQRADQVLDKDITLFEFNAFRGHLKK